MKPLFIILFSLNMLAAQCQVVQWATKGGGTASDLSKNITVDLNGNSYVTGSFQSTITFGPYSMSTGQVSATNTFFARYDSFGNVIWVRQVSGGQNAPAAIVFCPSQQCLYVAGKFIGTIVFGSCSLTSYGNNDCFFARYDLNGNCLWAIKAGSINGDWVDDIECDLSGNLVATGMVQSNGIFGSFIVPVHPLFQTFTTSISPFGTFQWLTISCYTNGTGVASPNTSVKSDISGNIYVTGLFNTTCVFGTQTYTAGGLSANINTFLQKISPAGAIQWTIQMSGSTNVESLGISTDVSGNVFVTGDFKGTINFGGITKTALGALSSCDIFLAKYDPFGNLIFVNQYGNTTDDYGKSIEVMPNGNMIMAGYYIGSTQIGSYSFTSAGNNDGYVTLLDPSGNTLWASSYGGTTSDIIMCAVTDNVTGIFCTGYFTGAASVYGSYSLSAFGANDVSVFKISLPIASLPVELLSFAVEPVSKNTAALCQWTTLSEIHNNYFTLEKSNDGKLFKPLAEIPGAGNSSVLHEYEFTDNHPYDGLSYYRLSQTDDNGSTEIIKTVAFHLANQQPFSFQCYPTISQGELTIVASDYISEIKVTDLCGKTVRNYFYSAGNPTTELLLTDLKKGMYFIRAIRAEESCTQKIIIQ